MNDARSIRWFRGTRMLKAVALASLLALTVAATPPGSPGASPITPAPTGPVTYEQHILPLLKTYCFDCHGNGEDKGGLSLEDYPDMASVAENPEAWLDIYDMIDFHDMPPRDEPQPNLTERDLLVGWIDTTLNRLDCGGPTDPGRVTIRRLNRNEYRNTIRDLVGVDFDPAADFPADNVGYGFDNIGDVLSVSTLLMEEYLAAASEISHRALVAGPASEQPMRDRAIARALQTFGETERTRGGVKMLFDGEFFLQTEFKEAGEYAIRIRAWGDQAGDEPVKMAVRLDGRDVEVIEVKGHDRDNRESPETQTYEVRATITPGEHLVSAAFINDYRKSAVEDRNLILAYMEVEGPLGAADGSHADPRERIMIAYPGQDGLTEDEATRKILSHFATRAYRRPVTEDELGRLLDLTRMVREQGEGFDRQIQIAIQAVLVSPHFLFRVEQDQPPDDAEHPIAGYTITDYELASRLSYFLWSSMPDKELFDLASRNELRKNGNLEKQVRRMLKDPKATTGLVQHFGGQWLQTRNLQTVSPDPDVFPEFDASLRSAMARETLMFFEAIMREDRSILEFLDADFTYLNEELAKHYGMEGVTGDQFQRVDLGDGPRGGVLTQASVLTITSDPTRTSPVKRGKWVMVQILGTPPPPPPPDVPELSEDEGVVLSGTLRERMEQHRANPQCAVCHIRMDAIGFAFENFDGVGGWRNKDGKFPIDASGKLPDGRSFNGPAELKKVLLADKEKFVENLAEKMLTYALGRGLEYYDRCAIEDIRDKVAENDYRFSSLVMAIVQSDPFQKRRGKDVTK